MRHIAPAGRARQCALWLIFIAAAGLAGPAGAAVTATSVTSSQKSAALEFLQAVASGDAEAVARALHPEDLKALRLRILTLLHSEAKRGDHTVRDRLFGPAR